MQCKSGECSINPVYAVFSGEHWADDHSRTHFQRGKRIPSDAWSNYSTSGVQNQNVEPEPEPVPPEPESVREHSQNQNH